MNVNANTSIEILDVGPRDGLQNDPTMVSTDNKIALIGRLIDAGIKRIEVGSFVNPKAVPQMAGTEEVLAGLPARGDIGYIGLIMNERGLLRALNTRDPNGNGINEVGCVVLTSDTFGQKNQGQTAQESVDIALGLLSKAKAEGMRAQVTISAAFGCPFEGTIPADRVIRFAEMLANADPVEIAIADSIGVAGPQEVEDLFAAIAETFPCAGIFIIRAIQASPMYGRPFAVAPALLMPASVVSAGAPLPPRPQGTFPPKTWYICWSVRGLIQEYSLIS